MTRQAIKARTTTLCRRDDATFGWFLNSPRGRRQRPRVIYGYGSSPGASRAPVLMTAVGATSPSTRVPAQDRSLPICSTRVALANGRIGAGRAIPSAKTEWPRRVDLTRWLTAIPTAGRGAIPVIRDHGTSDLVPLFADPLLRSHNAGSCPCTAEGSPGPDGIHFLIPKCDLAHIWLRAACFMPR
jgi:hypothetical protein